MRGRNTHVAKVPSMSKTTVCTATSCFLTGLGGYGSFPSVTSFVLIFEVGHKLPRDDTDDLR